MKEENLEIAMRFFRALEKLGRKVNPPEGCEEDSTDRAPLVQEKEAIDSGD